MTFVNPWRVHKKIYLKSLLSRVIGILAYFFNPSYKKNQNITFYNT